MLQATAATAFFSVPTWHSGGIALQGILPRPRLSRRPQASGVVGLSAQIKFADAVEEVLVRKWDKKKVSRVVKSWRRMDEDYIHKEFWKEHDTWQECNSFVEGLPCKTFHDPYEYGWANKLKENAKTIQEEFTRVAIEGSDDLDKKGNNVWATAGKNAHKSAYYENYYVN